MLLRNSLSSVSAVFVGASVAFQTCGKNIAKPNTTIKANIPSADMLSLVFSSMVSDGGFLYQPRRLTLKSITTAIATICKDMQAQRKERGASKTNANIKGMDTAKAIPSNKMHRVFAFISFLLGFPKINPPCNREIRLLLPPFFFPLLGRRKIHPTDSSFAHSIVRRMHSRQVFQTRLRIGTLSTQLPHPKVIS